MALTRRGKAVAAATVVVMLFAGAAIVGYFYLRSLGVYGPSAPGKRVHLVIPKGASAAEVGRLLEAHKIIPSALGFRIYLKIHGQSPTIQAGTYDLRRGLNVKDALAALVLQGPHVRYVRVTFPEGSWVTDFARIVGRETHISGKGFLRVARSGQIRSSFEPPRVKSLEGLLFPSTYQVVAADTARTVVRRLVEQFDSQVSKLDLSKVQAMGYTPYQAVIVASMVEAEAKVN
ncbi:MAG: endolytic transglycosylase MltG, partial [Actinomycetota bacterium]|nr:endolytic transglycosylase MltG [Actinomycetota bacterium]